MVPLARRRARTRAAVHHPTGFVTSHCPRGIPRTLSISSGAPLRINTGVWIPAARSVDSTSYHHPRSIRSR